MKRRPGSERGGGEPRARPPASRRTTAGERATSWAWVAMAWTLMAVAPGPARAQSDTTSTGVEARDPSGTVRVFGHADYDWAIRPLDGEATSLEAFRGEVLFINLWASWCTPCVREMAGIQRLRDALDGSDVTFLMVAADEERPVRRFLRQYGYDLPIYLEEQRVPAAFGLRGLPTTWVVDRLGRIVLVRHGEAVWDTPEVVAFLRSVAEG